VSYQPTLKLEMPAGIQPGVVRLFAHRHSSKKFSVRMENNEGYVLSFAYADTLETDGGFLIAGNAYFRIVVGQEATIRGWVHGEVARYLAEVRNGE
jgi:hypothetical protein